MIDHQLFILKLQDYMAESRYFKDLDMVELAEIVMDIDDILTEAEKEA